MISVCKKAQKSYQMHFSDAKKSRKRSGVVYSCFKDSAFTAVKRGS